MKDARPAAPRARRRRHGRGVPGLPGLPVLWAPGLLVLAACVAYRPAPVDVPSAAASFGPLRPGPLPFEEAVSLLVERNPELRRLRAEAAAVNLRPGPEPLMGTVQVMDGDVTETMLGMDVLSLLGIGPVQAERALARAMRGELILQHHERARALVARLAQAYAVEQVLVSLASPHPDLDVDAFERAGLAAGASLEAARAAHAQAQAEEAVVAASLGDVRREIAALVGADPESVVEPVALPEGWPPIPAPEERAVLYARGDLLRLLGAYEVADRRLRLAVVRQWPNLGLRLGAEVQLGAPMQMIEVTLPLDAPAEARAMVCAREAARRALEEGVLAAMHEAASARFENAGAEAQVRGMRAQRLAASSLVRAVRGRIEAEAEEMVFENAVLAAMEEVRAATMLREAAVAAARARVRAAEAAGWPGPWIQEACR